MAKRKILLVHPRQYDMLYANMKRAYHMRRYPPLGLMYISASLEKGGYLTEIIDTTIAPISSQKLVNKIKSEDYLFVGFYADMATKKTVLEYLKLIKSQLNIPIVMGGPASLSQNGNFQGIVNIICKHYAVGFARVGQNNLRVSTLHKNRFAIGIVIKCLNVALIVINVPSIFLGARMLTVT